MPTMLLETPTMVPLSVTMLVLLQTPMMMLPLMVLLASLQRSRPEVGHKSAAAKDNK